MKKGVVIPIGTRYGLYHEDKTLAGTTAIPPTTTLIVR